MANFLVEENLLKKWFWKKIFGKNQKFEETEQRLLRVKINVFSKTFNPQFLVNRFNMTQSLKGQSSTGTHSKIHSWDYISLVRNSVSDGCEKDQNEQMLRSTCQSSPEWRIRNLSKSLFQPLSRRKIISAWIWKHLVIVLRSNSISMKTDGF